MYIFPKKIQNEKPFTTRNQTHNFCRGYFCKRDLKYINVYHTTYNIHPTENDTIPKKQRINNRHAPCENNIHEE